METHKNEGAPRAELRSREGAAELAASDSGVGFAPGKPAIRADAEQLELDVDADEEPRGGTPQRGPGEKAERAEKAQKAQKRVANNTRRLRMERMMSKAELARRAGVSTLTIDRVERGMKCRMDTKRKIIEALGLKPSDRSMVFAEDD